jgi:hypothetical protein
MAILLVMSADRVHLDHMDEFNFQAPAEVYASRGRGASKRPMTFHRFDNAAEAVRFVMETLPPEMLYGTVMEIGEARFLGNDIKRLYSSDEYPLERAVSI